jgi:hypothetical protein
MSSFAAPRIVVSQKSSKTDVQLYEHREGLLRRAQLNIALTMTNKEIHD